jgi:hypothetical protein
MVSELRKQQLREAAAAALQSRWGTVRPEAMQEVAEDLRARAVEEGLLDRPAEAIAAVRQSLDTNPAWERASAQREIAGEQMSGRERESGFER